MAIRAALILALLVIPSALAENGDTTFCGKSEASPKSTADERGGPERSTAVCIQTNLTGSITSLLKSFAKLTTSDNPLIENGAHETLVNALRIEIFTMATGKNFLISPSANRNLSMRQTASAHTMTILWRNLLYTEDTDSIVNSAVQEVVTQHKSARKPLTMSVMQEMLRTVFNKLNESIEADPLLSTLNGIANVGSSALARIWDIRRKTYISWSDMALGQVDEAKVNAWLEDEDIQKFLVHRQFLDMKRETQGGGDDRAWACSVLRAASKPCCFQEMQDIYSTALKKVAKRFPTADFPRGTTRALVNEVTKKILAAEDTTVKLWTVQKKMCEASPMKMLLL